MLLMFRGSRFRVEGSQYVHRTVGAYVGEGFVIEEGLSN